MTERANGEQGRCWSRSPGHERSDEPRLVRDMAAFRSLIRYRNADGTDNIIE